MKKTIAFLFLALSMLVREGACAANSPDADDKSFVNLGAGAVPRSVTKKMEEWASVTDYGATPDDGSDDTAAFQKAIAAHAHVYIPAGKYIIDPAVGLILRTGMHLVGAGKNQVVLEAKMGSGCNAAKLANYSSCAVIRRQFNAPPGSNSRVNDVYLADFAIVLNHPSNSVTTSAIQIGIDFRNVTRSMIERVHVGNIAPIGGAYNKKANGSYDVQGYGILIGNVSSGSPAYAGGEVNTIRDCSVWGAYKLISIDDKSLSPASAAHGTVVVNSDLQSGHHLLVQESQYTTGTTWRDNVLQDVKKQPGDLSNSYVMHAEGYNQEMSGGYIEAGSGANFLLYLGTASKNNHFRLSYYSAANAAAITDAGQRNDIVYFENSGLIAGGVDSQGAPVHKFNRAYKRAWLKFHWNGSAIVIDGGQGATVARTAAGDYTVTWTQAFPNPNYALSALLDTDASGHAGTVTVGAQTANSTRIYTYVITGGASNLIDPRAVWVQAEQ